MARFLVFEGIPGSAIQTETASTSTRENALYAARLLSGARGRLVLLTSDFHTYRAHRAFLKAGLAVQPRPFGDALKRSGSAAGRWSVFLEELDEVAKIVYYRARGWI